MTRADSLANRMLPQAVEAERAVLGACLVDGHGVLPEASAKLPVEAFYLAQHQTIFAQLVKTQDKAQPVDMVLLQQRLTDAGQLESVGGAAYLSELLMGVPTTANADYYIAEVLAKHRLRQMIGACSAGLEACYNGAEDVPAVLDAVEQGVFAVTQTTVANAARTAQSLNRQLLGQLARAMAHGGAVTGLATGFRALDMATTGLHPGNLVVAGGRPSEGKSAFVLNVVEHVACDQQLPVVLFTPEMTSEEAMQRLWAARAGGDVKAIRGGQVDEAGVVEITRAVADFDKAPLHIDDTPSITLTELRSKARRLVARHGIRLIAVDYLQRCRAPSRRAETNRTVEIADLSGGLKALAKELGVPVLVASQINRQAELRERGRPRLADLAEGGTIEQDADVVFLLWRPERYADSVREKDREAYQAQWAGKAVVLLEKQRNGPIGEFRYEFRAQSARFEEEE